MGEGIEEGGHQREGDEVGAIEMEELVLESYLIFNIGYFGLNHAPGR